MIEFILKIDFSKWEWWQITLTTCLLIMLFMGKHKEVLTWLRTFLPSNKG